MIERDGLMRVFWPADLTTSEQPGVIVGWRNSGLDVVVVAVLDHVDVSHRVPYACACSRFLLCTSDLHPDPRLGASIMH